MSWSDPRIVDTLADRLEAQGETSARSDADGMVRRMAIIAAVALLVIVLIRTVAGSVM